MLQLQVLLNSQNMFPNANKNVTELGLSYVFFDVVQILHFIANIHYTHMYFLFIVSYVSSGEKYN